MKLILRRTQLNLTKKYYLRSKENLQIHFETIPLKDKVPANMKSWESWIMNENERNVNSACTGIVNGACIVSLHLKHIIKGKSFCWENKENLS